MPAGSASRRRKISLRDAVLGPAALEAPLPGPLLVLLSRLHRSEAARHPEGEDSVA